MQNLSTTFTDWTKNSTISGYKYLNSPSKIEQFFWCVIHLTTLTFIYFMIVYNWQQFTTNPTVTTLDSFSYPITKIAMPGVSICNINKISRSQADLYAQTLSNKSGSSPQDIFEKIKLLGRLYDYSLAPSEEELIIQFQNFLDKYDATDNGTFNMEKTLQALTKPCTEMLSDCHWHGNSYNCQDLFVTELTMDGHCCVFNYFSEQTTTNIPKVLSANNFQPLTGSGASRSDGLSAKIYANLSDYVYTTLATVGWKVLISIPTDYPDTTSGGLIEKLVAIGKETFIKLSTVTTMTTSEVRKYPVDKRRCIFRDEQTTLFGGYSYSDCIMDCKIKSIMALCKCIPFNYVNVFRKNPVDQCTLADIKCLSSYIVKWSTMYPDGVDLDDDALDREQQDSLRCARCVPACSDTTYVAKSESSYILNLSGKDLNYSVLHVFFDQPFGVLNKQDVYFYWFDIISIFGGICSLVMGVSIISLVEFVYFFTFRFWLNANK